MKTRDLAQFEFHDAEVVDTVIRRDGDQRLDVCYSLLFWPGGKDDGKAVTLRFCNCDDVQITMHAIGIGPDSIDSVNELSQTEAATVFHSSLEEDRGAPRPVPDRLRRYRVVFHCGGVADIDAAYAEVEC